MSRELQDYEVEGFIWYGALFLVSFLLLSFVWYQDNKRVSPRYGIVIKNTYLLLRLCVMLPFCSLLLGVIFIGLDLKSPREQMLPAAIGVRDTNVVGLFVFTALLFLAFLLTLNPFVLVNFAKAKFMPLFPTKEELAKKSGTPPQNLEVCVVSVWNGYWTAQLAKKLTGAKITIADNWMHGSTRDALSNLYGEGIAPDTLQPVKTPFTKLNLPNEKYDLVFGPQVFFAVSDYAEKEQVTNEMYRILRPSGQLFIISNLLSAGEAAKLLTEVGFTNIEKTVCWPTFFPLVLFRAQRGPTGGAPPSKAAPRSVSVNDPEVGVRTPLMAANRLSNDNHFGPPELATPQFGAVRALLTFGMFCLMVTYLVVLTEIWPSLDIPEKITDFNRLTSGFLLPFAQPFGLILLDSHEEISDYSRNPTATKESVVKEYCKRAAIGQAVSFLWNLILWLPSMLIDYFMVEQGVDQSTASTVNLIVVIVLLYISIKVGKKMSEKKKE